MAESAQVNIDRMLRQRLSEHIHRFFTTEASAAYEALELRFVPYAEAVRARGPLLAVPVDGAAHTVESEPWHVPFGATRLTLWNRLETPGAEGWSAIPDESSPLWYRHTSGTLVPAWDLAGLLTGLLTLQEESSHLLDRHGRFPASASPRKDAGLLQVPAFNEAAAAIVAAAMARTAEEACSLPDGALRPPMLILSHDVDVLMGNDPWAQFMRCGGAIAPLARLRAPNLTYLRLIVENSRDPRRYYLADVDRMVEVERRHGFRSAFYFLLGRRGLYGPRYGTSAIGEALEAIPEGWIAGVHYGYYSHLDRASFATELSALGQMTGHAPRSGRAHYLRYDPERSPAFLASFGVCLDESLGYPDAVGYRAGIAGPYAIPGVTLPDGSPMYEMPLAIMDGPLLGYEDPLGTFETMLRHLKHVGGALSVLTHPGTMDNPQRPGARGLYASMLEIAADLGATGMAAEHLLGPGGETS